MTLPPRTDEYTSAVIDTAAETLTNLAGLPCPDDPGVRLHALASLAQQINITIADAAVEARQHDYQWEEIAEILDITTDTAQRLTEISS